MADNQRSSEPLNVTKHDVTEPLSLSEYQRVTGDVITWGSLGLALAMATETGIVHVLCQADTPLASSEVAEKAGLKERYVREVLLALTAARLLQLVKRTGDEEGEERFLLHVQHRDTFRRTAASSLMFSYCGRIFDDIKTCFQPHTPSSVRYNAAAHQAMDEMKADDTDSVLQALLETPGLRQRLESGIEMAEIGCGTARVARRMAAMFPRSRFTVTDVTWEAMSLGREAAEREGLTNVSFQILDACEAPPAEWNERFDWILANDVIHDLPHPQTALDGVFRSLRPGGGGHFSLVDQLVSSDVAGNVGDPAAIMLYAMDLFFCIPESYQRPDSLALGACWGEERARAMLERAGFQVLGVTRSDSLGSVGVCMCQKG